MTAAAERYLRTHQAFPPAVTIRSGPAPPPTPFDAREVDIPGAASSSAGTSAPAPRWPQGYASYDEWKAWHINPAAHGPAHLARLRPPVFVPSQTQYDELGRGVDVVDVVVDHGPREGGGREAQQGESVAAWYTALSRAGSGASTPVHRESEAELSLDSNRGRKSPVIIDLTMDDSDSDGGGGAEVIDARDTDHHRSQGRGGGTTAIDLRTKPAASRRAEPRPAVRVHRNEWFIRRALVSAANATLGPAGAAAASRHARSSDARPRASIADMVHIDPTLKRVVEPQYVLGAENKGHQILRDRLGWAGGGLGRPVGWTGVAETAASRDVGDEVSVTEANTNADADARPEQLGRHELGASGAMDILSREPDPTRGHGIPSDSDAPTSDGSDMDDPDFIRPFTAGEMGPGRTAPISTTLKLDKLGLGHPRARPRPRKGHRATESDNEPDPSAARSGARVTHTHEEILRAQRRAKYLGAGRAAAANREGKTEMGKRAKVRWKERDKSEREERRRMIATMNS